MNQADNTPKILVVLTGGTICSSTDEKGELFSNVNNAKIVEAFKTGKEGKSPLVDMVKFDELRALDILSENMTLERWNTLLEKLNSTNWDLYKGIIILHGTDTLAYVSSLLSITLAGVKIPVCLVSSQLPPDHVGTNAHANFRASVELIMNGIAPNVYAVYRNSDNRIYAHYGAHLLQCTNYSDDFFSEDRMEIPDPENACLIGKPFETNDLYIQQMGSLSPCVLKLVPYVGLDYDMFSLEGIRAIVHGTYHSQSVCVERSKGIGDYNAPSILKLMDRCRPKNIPVFLAPCSSEAFHYESTGDAIRNGASFVYGMTNEMAYVKTLIGCALGYDGADLQTFLEKNVNNEVIY